MGRNDQVSRIVVAIGLLETNPRGFSVKELHAKLAERGFHVEPRTVYRDLEAIALAYFPVVREGSGTESHWKLDPIAEVKPTILFSYRELMALFISRHVLDEMRGSPVYDALQSLFFRMEKLLGEKGQKGLADLDNYLGFKARPTWQSGIPNEVMQTIDLACAEGHALEIEYRSVTGPNQGEIKKRKVGPARLFFADAGAYLIAQDLSSNELKMYALSRVHSAVLLDEEFDSHGLVTKDFLQTRIGVLSQGVEEPVEIEIREPMASYVSERRWNDSQTVARTPAGIVLRMNVRINDELARWVLGLGPEAKVILPQSLSARVKQMAEDVASSYGSGAA